VARLKAKRRKAKETRLKEKSEGSEKRE